jgi:hypothetical protein
VHAAAAFHRNSIGWCSGSDILKADFERSTARRDASHLEASVGKGFSDAFDFSAMARVLASAGAGEALADRLRKRLYQQLAVLTSRAFLPEADAGVDPAAGEPYTFAFDSCSEALGAFRKRMPAVIALAKAIAIAELEIDGQYRESRHDLSTGPARMGSIRRTWPSSRTIWCASA